MKSFQIRKGYLDTEHGQLHYRTTSPAWSRQPLVMLHQTASSSVMYEALMHCLGGKYWVVAPDTPGFGNSSAPNVPLSIEEYGSAIVQAIAQLGVERCWLFGHHTGAAIAVYIASNYPDLVTKLMLAGPTLLSETQIDKFRAVIRPKSPTHSLENISDIWHRISAKDISVSAELAYRETLLTAYAGEHTQSAYEAVFAQPLTKQLNQITCPTLILTGELDSLAAAVEPTAAHIPDVTVQRLKDVGTYMCDLQPEIVSNAIRDFIG